MPATVAPLGPGFLITMDTCETTMLAGPEQMRSGATTMRRVRMTFRERCEYLPSRREIVAACAAIQRQWTPAERRRRSVGSRHCETVLWTPPFIATASCTSRVRKMVAEAAT
jgi:hypothetical protein